MRGTIVTPDVGLDLDDPADAPAGLVLADEPRPDQRARCLQRGSGKDGSVDDAQASG
jgi:hypothetical protein